MSMNNIETRQQQLRRKITLNSWNNSRKLHSERFLGKLGAIPGFEDAGGKCLSLEKSYDIISKSEDMAEPAYLTVFRSPILTQSEFSGICKKLKELLGEKEILFWFHNHQYMGVFRTNFNSLLPTLVGLLELDGDCIFVRDAIDLSPGILFDFSDSSSSFPGYTISVTGQKLRDTLSSNSDFENWKLF